MQNLQVKMGGRRQSDSQLGRNALFILFLMGTLSCFLLYLCFIVSFRPSADAESWSRPSDRLNMLSVGGEEDENCCRGIQHLELWGDAVKWGSEFKLNSSKDCCMACKAMCGDKGEPCLCDSWVFCGDKQACGSQFGQCWLKKQKNILEPDRRDSGSQVVWTSGLVYGKEEGIIAMKTDHGTVRIKLLPDCAPHSAFYILELLKTRHCPGCKIYRAEGRGRSWDSKGNHINHASYGPPFALIQGTLEAHGVIFEDIPREGSPRVRRGSVAWVSSGPDFFISLANHEEWKDAYTVFGFVLPEDMEIVERISELPTKAETWNNINVAVLENHVPLHFQRLEKSISNTNKNVESKSSGNS